MDNELRDATIQTPVSVFSDPRGTLTLVATEHVPFTARRTYVLHHMPAGAIRGGHANLTQARLLVGLSGCATVTLDDGHGVEQVELVPGKSLLIEPAVWHEIQVLDVGTEILVFAEGDYDPGDMVVDRRALAAH